MKRLTVLSIAVLLALLVAAVLPFAALAQDGGEQPPAGEAVSPAEEPVVDEAVPPVEEAVPPVDEAVPPVDEVVPPVDEVVPLVDETLTVPEVLAQIPAETDLVVLGADGQAVPLASVEAADAILFADPMWCPVGVLPGGDGCTAKFPSFTALITELNNGTGTDVGAGTIYIAYDYNATTAGDYGNNIVFDYAKNKLDDLIFQGGWDFTSNKVVGTSTFDLGAGNYLAFLDWGGYGNTGVNLTLKDINVVNSGGLYAGDYNDDSNANVTLDNVSVSNNVGGFVGTGASVWTTGDVTVINSDFDSNTDSGDPEHATGLRIAADGNVTLNTISASYNNGDGVDITGYNNDASASVLVENSVFNGNYSTDTDNWGIGLYIAVGSATLRCSQLNDNSQYGVWADGPGTLTDDSNSFSGNGSGYNGNLTKGATVAFASSGCGGGGDEGGRKNKNLIVTYLPQATAIITPLTDAELPGALPEGKTFVASMSVKLMQGGAEIEEALGGVQVSFDIPAGMEPPFTVLSWNGTEWVEVPSTVVDGKVVFTVNGPGIFVLVSP